MTMKKVAKKKDYLASGEKGDEYSQKGNSNRLTFQNLSLKIMNIFLLKMNTSSSFIGNYLISVDLLVKIKTIINRILQILVIIQKINIYNT